MTTCASRSPSPMQIEYLNSGKRSDSLGRSHFALRWVETDDEGQRCRSQHFYADPRKYGFRRPEEVQ